MNTDNKKTEKQFAIHGVSNSTELEVKSFCCSAKVSKVNTTNDIICYKCYNCGNLCGVTNKQGKRTG